MAAPHGIDSATGKVRKDVARYFEQILETAPNKNSSCTTTYFSPHKPLKEYKICRALQENLFGWLFKTKAILIEQ